MTTDAEALELVDRMRDPAKRTQKVVDQYYTFCIPFYREFLGDHWHTGFYLFDDRPIGPQDQLRMERGITESAELAPDRQVLDVGCGIGGPACYLAGFTGAHIRGLTPNAVQLQLASKLAINANVADRVGFDLRSASALPYPDNSFDAVLFFESPCHFPDRNQFFREVWRVLRHGGRLAGEDWLAKDGLNPQESDRYIQPICKTWAIPKLGTRTEYASGMVAAGFEVRDAVDLRGEMALQRGFLVNKADRDDVCKEKENTSDPIRKIILEGLLRLGEAAEAGAFTLGRFLAVKE